MAKRPTTPQIRARAVKIVKYQLTTNKTDTQVARDLGVKPKTIKKLKSGNFKAIRRTINKSPDLKKAYEKAGNVSGRGRNRLNDVRLVTPAYTRKSRRYTRVQNITIEERDREYRSGVYIERYYVNPENATEQTLYNQRSTWAELTAEYETESGVRVPISITDIRVMRDAGDISEEEYAELEALWEETYGIGRSEEQG